MAATPRASEVGERARRATRNPGSSDFCATPLATRALLVFLVAAVGAVVGAEAVGAAVGAEAVGAVDGAAVVPTAASATSSGSSASSGSVARAFTSRASASA